MEYQLWTEMSGKYIDAIIKYLVFYVSTVGVVLVFNLNRNFHDPESLSLIFVALFSLCTAGVAFGPARYLSESIRLMNELTHELGAKLVPTLNVVQGLLWMLVVLSGIFGLLATLLVACPHSLGFKSL